MNIPAPIDPTTLARLIAYVQEPRIRRTVRHWSLDELLLLLDPAMPVQTIAEGLGVKRAVVTYELVRLRRAGFPVPDRLSGVARAPHTRAMENDLRAGMTDAEAARTHGVTPARVRDVRVRAGIPVRSRAWTEQERELLIAHQDRPAHEVAALVGRTASAVWAERRRLIGQGRVRPKITRLRKG